MGAGGKCPGGAPPRRRAPAGGVAARPAIPRPGRSGYSRAAVTALLLVALGTAAGALGALMGVGGGIVVVPVLTQAMAVPFPAAVAVSLVVIVVSSSAAGATYVRLGLADLRVGVVLEVGTVAGAVFGSWLAGRLPSGSVQLVFAAVAIYTGRTVWSHRARPGAAASAEAYRVRRWGLGLAAGFVAGVGSGLVGVGGGFLLIPVMSLAMGLPFRRAAATSSFMIGVTGAASAYIYYARGDLDLALTAPILLGVVAGSRLGVALLPRIPVARLQGAFALLLAVVGLRMALDAWRLLR